jgi:hypothetical protein
LDMSNRSKFASAATLTNGLVALALVVTLSGAIGSLVIGVTASALSAMVSAAVYGALVAGLVSIVLAGLSFAERWSERFERARAETESRIFDTLRYFEGGSQTRNVGISVMETYWEDSRLLQLRDLCVPLLANQAMYLLRASDQKDKPHEQDNLRRIIALLERAAEQMRFPQSYESMRKAVRETRWTALGEGSMFRAEHWRVGWRT